MGRTEKYANVLEEDSKNNSDIIMSSTRQIKFKEIHDEIEELEKEPTKEIIIRKKDSDIEKEKEKLRLKKQETFMTKNDLFSDLMNKQEKSLKVKELDDVTITKIELPKDDNIEEINENDMLGINNGKNHLLVTLIILLVIFVCGYIFLFPVIKSLFITTGKETFDNSIDYLTKEILNIYDYSSYDETYYEIKYNVLTDIENTSYESYIAKNGNNYMNGIKIDNNSIKYFRYNDKYYVNYNDSKNVYNVTNNMDEFNNITSIINNVNNKYNNDLNSFISFENEYLKNNIDESYINKNRDKLIINDKNYYVISYTLSLSGDQIIKLLDNNKNSIMNNKAIEASLSNILDMDIDDIYSKYFDSSKYNENDKLNISIYTDIYNNYMGFDIEENGFRIFYLYKDNKYNFNMYINIDKVGLNDYIDLNNIELKGIRDNDKINVVILTNNKEIGNMTINGITSNSLTSNYSYSINDVIHDGELSFIKNENKFSINYINKYDDKEIKYLYSINRTIDKSFDFNNYNITMFDKEENDYIEFNNSINANDSFNNIYKKIYGIDYK